MPLYHIGKRHFLHTYTKMTTECCVCFATTEDINAKYAASFITIPCGVKHIVCFPCFIQTQNGKCPMCRYDYVAGVKLDDEAQDAAERMRLEQEAHQHHEEYQPREEYEEQFYWDDTDHDYSYYQDLNRELNGNYQEEVDEAARIWKEFARLDQKAQDDIYEKLNRSISDKFYIYRQLRNEMRGNEDNIMRMFESSFDVCRVVYISKIISQPDNQEAYGRLKHFELWLEDELDNRL